MDLAASGTVTELTRFERSVLARIARGLPLVAEPYAEIAARLGSSEEQVISALRSLLARGVIKRLGVIVRHHELGYRANAMVVWDLPEQLVATVARQLAVCASVRLCYRRPRRLPDWPYNLFTMIHGRDRGAVLEEVQRLAEAFCLQHVGRAVLFSRKRFKQCGARYLPVERGATAGAQGIAAGEPMGARA